MRFVWVPCSALAVRERGYLVLLLAGLLALSCASCSDDDDGSAAIDAIPAMYALDSSDLTLENSYSLGHEPNPGLGAITCIALRVDHELRLVFREHMMMLVAPAVPDHKGELFGMPMLGSGTWRARGEIVELHLTRLNEVPLHVEVIEAVVVGGTLTFKRSGANVLLRRVADVAEYPDCRRLFSDSNPGH